MSFHTSMDEAFEEAANALRDLLGDEQPVGVRLEAAREILKYHTLVR